MLFYVFHAPFGQHLWAWYELEIAYLLQVMFFILTQWTCTLYWYFSWLKRFLITWQGGHCRFCICQLTPYGYSHPILQDGLVWWVDGICPMTFLILISLLSCRCFCAYIFITSCQMMKLELNWLMGCLIFYPFSVQSRYFHTINLMRLLTAGFYATSQHIQLWLYTRKQLWCTL